MHNLSFKLKFTHKQEVTKASKHQLVNLILIFALEAFLVSYYATMEHDLCVFPQRIIIIIIFEN